MANTQRFNKTGYRGVFAARKRWVAKIRFENKQIYLGIFTTPEDAAKAYDAKAKEIYGEFANTNF